MHIALKAALLLSALASSLPVLASEIRLTGTVGDVTSGELVWVGSIPVRLRDVFVEAENEEDAVALVRSLAPREADIDCVLSGERVFEAKELLVGTCSVTDPAGEVAVDLGARLLAEGLARPCKTPQAIPMIWPPVYICR